MNSRRSFGSRKPRNEKIGSQNDCSAKQTHKFVAAYVWGRKYAKCAGTTLVNNTDFGHTCVRKFVRKSLVVVVFKEKTGTLSHKNGRGVRGSLDLQGHRLEGFSRTVDGESVVQSITRSIQRDAKTAGHDTLGNNSNISSQFSKLTNKPPPPAHYFVTFLPPPQSYWSARQYSREGGRIPQRPRRQLSHFIRAAQE